MTPKMVILDHFGGPRTGFEGSKHGYFGRGRGPQPLYPCIGTRAGDPHPPLYITGDGGPQTLEPMVPPLYITVEPMIPRPRNHGSTVIHNGGTVGTHRWNHHLRRFVKAV